MRNKDREIKQCNIVWVGSIVSGFYLWQLTSRYLWPLTIVVALDIYLCMRHYCLKLFGINTAEGHPALSVWEEVDDYCFNGLEVESLFGWRKVHFLNRRKEPLGTYASTRYWRLCVSTLISSISQRQIIWDGGCTLPYTRLGWVLVVILDFPLAVLSCRYVLGLNVEESEHLWSKLGDLYFAAYGNFLMLPSAVSWSPPWGQIESEG